MDRLRARRANAMGGSIGGEVGGGRAFPFGGLSRVGDGGA